MKYIAWVVLLLIFPSVIMAETLEFVFSDFPPFEYMKDGKIVEELIGSEINNEMIVRSMSTEKVN